jgi:hypothetical protein
MGHKEGYVHGHDVIFSKIQETIDLGGTGVLMQGGLHPDLKIEWYEGSPARNQKAKFGDRIWLHCFSAPEIQNIAAGQSGFPRRHHRAPARRGPAVHSRRRRRDPPRRRPPAHQRA